jgi:Alkylmercury lyase
LSEEEEMSPLTTATGDLSPADLAVRVSVYQHFVDHGAAPSTGHLATLLEQDEVSIQRSLERLEAARVLTLTPGTRQIWMAHPFSAVPTPYPVETSDCRYWANCAWDALAIPSLLNVDAQISTTCPGCGEVVAANVEDGRLKAPADAVVHFLVPPKQFWDNIGFT